MFKEKEITILINSGDVFEGYFSHFEDCFFSFPETFSTEEKLQAIKNWCESEGFTFSSEEKG